MIAPGTPINDATVLGYAQATVTLRTIDGREIVRRRDRVDLAPDEVYALDNGCIFLPIINPVTNERIEGGVVRRRLLPDGVIV